MDDKDKSRDQLLGELNELRRRVAELEKADNEAALTMKVLRDSESKFRILVKFTYDWIFWLDIDYRFVYSSPSCDRITGYTADEFIKNSSLFLQIIHPDDRALLIEHRKTYQSSPEHGELEFRIICRDGSVRWLGHVCKPIITEDGTYSGRCSSNRDLTERKRIEEALRESEIKFQNTVKYLDEGYYSCTLEGLLLEHNQAFNQILGFDVTLNLKGEQLPDFWQNPEDRKEYLNELMAEGFIRNYLINAQTISGRKIVVMANSHLVKDDKDRIIRIDGTFTDFTEPKRIQDELERSNKELEQFAYVASHDLQEPLRMISSFTQLLARRYEDKLDAEANEFIDYAVDGANRMQKLINDLLTYSRVGTKGKPFATTDLNSIMGQVLIILNPVIEENHAIITNNELPTASVDESQMVQLFQNLIGNAIKFRSMEPPLIHVSVNENDREWTFGIKDNGIGIDLQYKERIFGVFQRLHSKEEYPGTGIGLAICKKIVERHGGRIWIESTPGKGSAFYFTLSKHNGQQ